MIKVGVTGQEGFIGTHLFNTLGLYPDKYIRIPFYDTFFSDKEKLIRFVSSCDVIVHLAAMNRHNDPKIIYSTNILLVKQVIEACELSHSTPYIIFSSSTQEERDNLYGKSKKEGYKLFEKWARTSGARFTGLVIPNVFGPFGKPYYNSVVATFCYQLTHNEKPKIEVDSEIKLINVGDLVDFILDKINMSCSFKIDEIIERCEIPYAYAIKVSELLKKLNSFKEQYFKDGIIPDLSNPFDRNLFNILLTYNDHNSFFPFHLKQYKDKRGSFVEILKLNSRGQVSFSITNPGNIRGNHFHTRKAERFAVIKGKAKIEFRRVGTTEKFTFKLDGNKPSFVDMPVWYTHKITNVGTDMLYTIFWISEHFDPSDPDTFFELV
ncbi:MAG: NAD-dependent epimerase/dehydratase family protein [Candidatus Delongbacteria bacterium]|nr:NAD-dependent epimerase/dehydratase family protein [Candidatus Delongbacteria bacterium]